MRSPPCYQILKRRGSWSEDSPDQGSQDSRAAQGSEGCAESSHRVVKASPSPSPESLVGRLRASLLLTCSGQVHNGAPLF